MCSSDLIAELKGLLENDPGNYHVIALLVEIFVEKTDDHANAVGLISAFLRKDGRCSQDVPIVMKLVDVYLDIGDAGKAAGLLEDELKRKYPEKDIKVLKARLDGVRGQGT